MYKEHDEFKVTGFPATMVVGIKRGESMIPGPHFWLKQMGGGGNITEVCIAKEFIDWEFNLG